MAQKREEKKRKQTCRKPLLVHKTSSETISLPVSHPCVPGARECHDTLYTLHDDTGRILLMVRLLLLSLLLQGMFGQILDNDIGQTVVTCQIRLMHTRIDTAHQDFHHIVPVIERERPSVCPPHLQNLAAVVQRHVDVIRRCVSATQFLTNFAGGGRLHWGWRDTWCVRTMAAAVVAAEGGTRMATKPTR